MTTKKALSVIGLLVFLVGLTLIVPARYVGVQKIKKPSLVLKTSDEISALRGDMDKNGIPDWKDMLIETTSSSTKAEADAIVVDEAAKARLNDPNNITASFSKSLYLATAYVKQKGDITAEEQEELANQILIEEGAKITFKEYAVTDLRLTKAETDVSRKAYGNALGVIYKKAVEAKLTFDDTKAIEAFSTSKDPAILESFIIKKNIMQSIITDLASMTVPYSAAPYHLLLINSLSKYKSILENIAQAENDPMRATMAYNAYMPTLQNLYSALMSLQNYFIIEKMTFVPGDAGYIFISSATKK
jgi:hypothetical protein